jgi:DNA ligase-1
MLIVTNKAASVYAAIEAIAATASTTEKEAMVKLALNSSPMFMKVVKAAYDPFVTYGMRALPERTAGAAPGTNTLDEEWPWEILSKLASRKLSGTAAWDAVQKAVDFLDAPSGALFTRIIRLDLRASFTSGTVNRVMPKTFPDFPYMRCSLPDKSDMSKWDWGVGIIAQEKADGMFTNVDIDAAGQASASGRSGSPIPLGNLPELAAALELGFNPLTQTHGELTIVDSAGVVQPREIGNGMLNKILGGGSLDEGYYARFEAWDQIPLSAVQAKGKCTIPYKERLTGLVLQLQRHPQNNFVRVIPTRIARTKAAAMAYYGELLKKGKEGVICKHPAAIWKDGTSKEQVKLKLEVDVDLRIDEILMGTPGTKTEGRPGSLRCSSDCNALVTNVTVKNEEMRVAIEADPESWLGGIMAVRANSIMKPGDSSEFHSLFLPRFVEAIKRTDKAVADDLAQIQSIFANAVEAA